VRCGRAALGSGSCGASQGVALARDAKAMVLGLSPQWAGFGRQARPHGSELVHARACPEPLSMSDEEPMAVATTGMFVPLRISRFRIIWIASVMSNLGLTIQGVAAAWTMTERTGDATLVAMVTSATLLPMVLFTLPAGAIADMYERRSVAVAALLISLTGVSTLFGLSIADALTPAALIALSFVAGCGMAFFWPAWQSSVTDDVPASLLPAAVGLNSISYNSARVLGPAVGGMIVAAGGAVIAFAISALLYLPMLGVQLRPARKREMPSLPPEPLGRAIVSGVRYVIHSPPVRHIVLRAFMAGALGGSVHALMPMISHDLLDSEAEVFGFLLGSFGLGAIIGVMLASRLRQLFGTEGSVRLCAIGLGVGLVTIALSRSPLLTAAALVLSGSAWMTATQAFNVGIQMSVPRWVGGRAVACFQAGLSGGIALGGLAWGLFAQSYGVGPAFLASGAVVALSAFLGLIWPISEVGDAYVETGEGPPPPEVQLEVTGRTGPVIVEIEYRIPAEQAADFYSLIEEVQLCRQRNGAYGLSIARDMQDPESWVERYQFPTWHDYLRQRERMTRQELELQQRAVDFHAGDQPLRARRLLERPFGSARAGEDGRERRAGAVFPMS